MNYKQITRTELEVLEKANFDLKNMLEFTNEELELLKKRYDELTIDQQVEIKDRTKMSIYSESFTTNNFKWYFKQSIPPNKKKYPFTYGTNGSIYTIYMITEKSLMSVYKTKDEYIIEQLMYAGRNTIFYICDDFNGLNKCLVDLIPCEPTIKVKYCNQ